MWILTLWRIPNLWQIFTLAFFPLAKQEDDQPAGKEQERWHQLSSDVIQSTWLPKLLSPSFRAHSVKNIKPFERLSSPPVSVKMKWQYSISLILISTKSIEVFFWFHWVQGLAFKVNYPCKQKGKLQLQCGSQTPNFVQQAMHNI